jgi:hypothetical protein
MAWPQRARRATRAVHQGTAAWRQNRVPMLKVQPSILVPPLSYQFM